MTTLREVAQQAVEALEDAEAGHAAQILRAALAEPDQPIAWGMPRPDGTIIDCITPEEHARMPGQYTVPLYAAPQPKAEQEPDEVKQIAEALRQVGLTLIRTGTGFRVADLGRVEAQTAPQPKAEPQPAAVKAAWLAGYTEGQKDAWAEPDDAAHHYPAPPEVQAAVDAAVAEGLRAEPVAWGMRRKDGLILDVICPDEHEAYEGEYTIPLYERPQPKTEPQEAGSLAELRDMLRVEVDRLIAAPQPRKRLTDADINLLRLKSRDAFDFARAIEAAVWGDGK